MGDDHADKADQAADGDHGPGQESGSKKNEALDAFYFESQSFSRFLPQRQQIEMPRLAEQQRQSEDDIDGQSQQSGVSQRRQTPHQPEEQAEGTRGVGERREQQNHGGED